MNPEILAKLERAFHAVGEATPTLDYLRRVIYLDDFDGGLYVASMDSEGRPWAWVGVYLERGVGRSTLPLQQFRRFLAIIAEHPQVDELRVSVHQSPNPRITGRILERLGFAQVDDHGLEFAIRTPQWERHHGNHPRAVHDDGAGADLSTPAVDRNG